MPSPSCIVVGAGPGNGLAFGKRFAAAGYRVALLSRDRARIERLAAEVDGATAQACDVTSAEAVRAAFAAARATLGEPEVLIYNAGAGAFGNVDAG